MPPSPLDPAQFAFPEGLCWLAHCSDGPLPAAAEAAAQRWLHLERRPWAVDWEQVLAAVTATRQAAAAVIGAEATDLSLVPSTSTALVELAQAFPWQTGDEVLAPWGEFPSNAWPWKALEARGVRFREVPLWERHQMQHGAPPSRDADPEDRLLAAIRPATRLVTASWVRFQDGLKLDLTRLGQGCRARGVALVVDGIQGAGTHVPDLKEVDAFACGGQKGLLGPQGSALLWTAPTLRSRLVPTGSWLSVQEGGNFALPLTDLDRAWLPDGRRLENQSNTSLQVLAFQKSLELLAQAPPASLAAHVRALQAELLNALRPHPPWTQEVERLQGLLAADRLGSILAFHGRPWTSLLARGAAQGIHATQREGFLRIAFHGWHTSHDVARGVAWLTARS